MAEQSPEAVDAAEDAARPDVAELPREVTDYEKKLRREVVRYREQARVAESDREAACAAAVRDRDETVAAVREETRGRVMRAELKAHAVRAGIVDLDGLRLADLGGLTVDEAGEVQGADEVIATLRQHKPYLFSTERAVASTGTTAQLQRPPAPAQAASVNARTLTRDAWQAERDRLLGSSR